MQNYQNQIDADMFAHHLRLIAMAMTENDQMLIDDSIGELLLLNIKDPFYYCASERLTIYLKFKLIPSIEIDEYIEFTSCGPVIKKVH